MDKIFSPCAYARYLRVDSPERMWKGDLRAEKKGSVELLFNGDSFGIEK